MMNSEDIKSHIYEMGEKAKQASYALANLSVEKKNGILNSMASELRTASSEILAANAVDIQNGKDNGLTDAMLDRLRLDADRIDAIAAGIEKVALLDDPVGQEMDSWAGENGMRIQQVRVPIGVIGIIYESRPNVTSDAAVLCLKSGNATILRGGSEAVNSNVAIADALQRGGESAGLPAHSIQLIPFTDRESVAVMAGMDRWMDLIIPRGGKGLIEAVVTMARMPVIKHYDGICHTYVHSAADLEMAANIVFDAKTQKPSVCNALETLLVDVEIADDFLPLVKQKLDERGVELRGDAATQAILGDVVVAASEADWNEEYLDYILAVKVVSLQEEAVAHINEYGSGHSDCIVTSDEDAAELFLRSVDSACVYHNVSTRFSDGEEFGFGAEIGISTDKLHARGPMALRELTSYQYRVRGEGQTKA